MHINDVALLTLLTRDAIDDDEKFGAFKDSKTLKPVHDILMVNN